jgi:hypothetical protein
MKKHILLLMGFATLIANGQTFEIGAGAGTGAYYIIEDADNAAIIAYDSPASLFVDVKYNFKGRIDGVKLRLQNMSVHVLGMDYQTGVLLDGRVESFTTSLLYERLRTDRVFNVGYYFGMGVTQQDFKQVISNSIPAVQDRFMSLTFGGVYALRIQENLHLNLETGFLWTDPINSFRDSENWQTAGEDLSFLAQLGLSYRF